jgi:hypothetical protein
MKFRYASAVLLLGPYYGEFATKPVVAQFCANHNGLTATSVCFVILAQSGV